MLLQKAAGKECCLVCTSEECVGYIAMVLMCTGNNYNYVFNELRLAHRLDQDVHLSLWGYRQCVLVDGQYVTNRQLGMKFAFLLSGKPFCLRIYESEVP